MDLFVNRESELELIDEAFNALTNKKRLVRTPLIGFLGVSGIGKTFLLRRVAQRCQDTQLPYIWVDVDQATANVAHTIITQIKQYTQIDTGASEQSPVHAAQVLLQQGPVVMLFDSVEMANTDQLSTIGTLLRDLSDDEKLFVVMASKKSLSFQYERSIARKLTTLSLKPFDREKCELYLEHQDQPTEPEIRNIIFEWTRGYPLAINVMINAIIERQLDPRTEQGQKVLLSLLTEEVIHQKVLVNIKPEEKAYYFSALQLFSLPRRSNLVLMQDLIETFTPELKRESSLAYFSLPRAITEATDVLSWNMARGGFSVDEPIRNIFLLILKMEQPSRYFEIHDFLTRTNLQLATEVPPGSDRVRYLRESLYHAASNTSSPHLSEQLSAILQAVLQEAPDPFLQFTEEFSQDDELKEVLGSYLATVQSMLDTHLNAINDQEAER